LHVGPPAPGSRHDAAAVEDGGFLERAGAAMEAAQDIDHHPFGYGAGAGVRGGEMVLCCLIRVPLKSLFYLLIFLPFIFFFLY